MSTTATFLPVSVPSFFSRAMITRKRRSDVMSVVSMKPGVPIQVNGVAIDLLSVQTGEDHLASALEAPMGSIIEAPQLVYLKLKSPRLKDRADIIELIKAGIDVQACRAYLKAHAPGLVVTFEDAVTRAAAEE